MAKKRSARGAVAAASSSLFAVLNEDALTQLLLAAKDAHTLGLLASSSRQLCSFARSRIPVQLEVTDEVLAGFIIRGHTHGRPPFSACTLLLIEAPELVQCFLAVGVLAAAQQWTALQQLQLRILRVEGVKQEWCPTLECCAATLLSGVPALQRLQRLELEAPFLGASCAVHIMQLTQLTSLQLTASKGEPAAAADLGAMAGMTNLVELRLNWALAPHLPPSREGPYCLPSTLVTLELSSYGHTSPAPMACWVAHLPGCPQLQHLELAYGREPHHHSTHPRAVVQVLAEHQPRLRSLQVPLIAGPVTFTGQVAGLPDAAGVEASKWHPSAALAALTGLERLDGGGLLHVEDQADWQHLVQLPALWKLSTLGGCCVPQLQPGSALVLLEVEQVGVDLCGRDLGRLLLACPLLKRAQVRLWSAAEPVEGTRLLPHPALEGFELEGCDVWGSPPQAAVQFAALAPVLSGVSNLEIVSWPTSSSASEAVLPDLSPCTALTYLGFGCAKPTGPRARPEQEAFLSMLAPLAQLQELGLYWVPQVNGRIALVLPSMLPQLQRVYLENCGRLVPAVFQGEDPNEEETGALLGLAPLVPHSLRLEMSGYLTWP
jgi:hypothetical protein